MMKGLAFVSLMLAMAGFAHAGQEDVIASCYDKKVGVAAPEVKTEIVVAIDQTTLLDMTLRQEVADNVKPFLVGNHGFAILTFSAFSQGRYVQVVTSGKIEGGIPEQARNDISKPLLSKFDSCLKKQPQQAMQVVGNALRSAFDGASTQLAKSDVMASFKAISSKVKNLPAKEKIVLIVSDMLENSSVSSFYTDKGASVRKIDPIKEMKLATDNDLLGDFGGAKVYVIGTGLLPDDATKAKKYRDPKTMQALASFWKNYFEKSDGKLVELGQPALLSPIK
ncbi:MAG: hypothetical protein JWQ21_1223 [Herminiimonas sp.]|nr:hypothetical protein [Herminiimonas sp.]